MIVGMDFGTTNTRAALYDGAEIRLMPVDPANPAQHISRTAIYLTRTGDYHLGSAAVNLYFNQNVGRPTRYRKIWVGEILQVFAELPAFYRDVYVFEDEFSPGRLFLSIKTALRRANYEGTVFQERWYSASDLAAVYLLGMKRNIEKHLGQELREIVLGRPVHFSQSPDEDVIAQSRLLEAAFKAGFEKVYLEYEPVAAALAYERKLKDKEMILVFDFGGGTLDFTVMQVGDPRSREVLATGGIAIGGDVFDQRLFRAAVPRHLGEGEYFVAGGQQYPIPAHIFDLLTTPQEVVALNTPQYQELLRSIHAGALNKDKTHALLELVSSNYALLMFDQIERAKRQLSFQGDTPLDFQTETFSIQDTLTRKQFERAIQREYEAIVARMMDTIERSGLKVGDIQRVIRTGGSSQIPLFTRMLNRTFGYDRVEEIDIFSSVTSGLAIRGQEISAGKSELRSYARGDLREGETLTHERSQSQALSQVDLRDVLQRMEVTESFAQEDARPAAEILLLVDPPALSAYPFDPAGSAGPSAGSLPEGLALTTRAYRFGLDSPLLLATNTFKLIASDARSLLRAAQLGAEAVRELLRLEAGDEVTAASAWSPGENPHRFISLVTRYAQARSFDARLLADQVLKRPYFELERRYIGLPAFLIPQDEASLLWVGTNQGRVAWAAPKEMFVRVLDLLKLRKDEEITCALAAAEGETLAAISTQAGALAIQAAAPTRLQSLHRNFKIAGLARLEPGQPTPLQALTNRGRLISVQVPGGLAENGKPVQLTHLTEGEEILSVL